MINRRGAFAFMPEFTIDPDDGFINVNGRMVEYDMIPDVKMLYEQYGKDSFYDVTMEFVVGDDKLILTHLDFIIDEYGEILITSFGGYFLEK
jgi:hypothetical protein